MSMVLLLNEDVEIIGVSEKQNAHETGAFHLAFSILIINSRFEMLIQKRAKHKYHSGGLWSNACCSHPSAVTNIENDLKERLRYEMGIDANVKWLFDHRYYAVLDNSLIENEYDHVFIGYFEGVPVPNRKEVDDWRWASFSEIEGGITNNPEIFTPWFKQIFEKFLKMSADI